MSRENEKGPEKGSEKETEGAAIETENEIGEAREIEKEGVKEGERHLPMMSSWSRPVEIESAGGLDLGNVIDLRRRKGGGIGPNQERGGSGLGLGSVNIGEIGTETVTGIVARLILLLKV